jgi:hypothetical protein
VIRANHHVKPVSDVPFHSSESTPGSLRASTMRY